MNKKILFFLMLISFHQLTHASYSSCSKWPKLFSKSCNRLQQIWYEGEPEGYFTFYAWHNRFTYTEEKLNRTHYNEYAWGGGLGKGFYDEDGDWHTLYAIAFLDSHKNVEPVGGYAFTKVQQISKHAKLGEGFSVFMTMRPDIFDGIPFPGAAPVLTFTYKRASLAAIYIPGKTNFGNVLLLMAKWNFAN